MKVITYTITHQAKLAGGQIESIMYTANFAARQIESIMYPVKFACGYSHSIMYPAKFAGGRSRLDLLLPSFLPSREEKKKQEQKNRPLGSRGVSHTPTKHLGRNEQKIQDRIFCPLRGHAVGRMQYAPTSYRQETLFPINSREERIETKIQEQKNRPLGSRAQKHTPHMDRIRIETKMQERRKQSIDSGAEWHTPQMNRVRIETNKQERIFCPLRGHVVGRMQYAPTSYRQETLYLINSQEERIETKMQEQKNHPLGSRGVLHTPHTNRERIGTKKQDRIFCPLRGHAVGRMQYAPTSCRQKRLFPINSRKERTETKMQEQKNRPLGSRGVLHMPHTDRVRTETKTQEQIFCPLRGHAVGRMQYAPTSFRQETLFPINSQEERTETKMQEQKSRPLGSRGVLHTPHMDRVRIETKMQKQIFCPLRGHVMGRMQYAPTSCRQETLFPINSQEERIETEMQEQKNYPSGSRGVLHTPHTDRVRIEKKKQERIFCPLQGYAVGRMQYAPTFCRQERLFPINSQEERTETKMQERKKQSINNGAELHTPHMDRVRTETKMQEQIFCPFRGHSVGRMQYAPTSCRQERLYLINSQEERTETKMQERRKQSIDNGAEWHTPFMRHGERDAVWREAFLEQRARVAIWRDRRLEERSSHARLQLKTFGENSNSYKSSLVALSEQLRDIFAD